MPILYHKTQTWDTPFKGWARLSAKFLNGITTTDIATGETALTIIKLLEETTLNLMELLNSDNYTPKLLKTVEEENYSDKEASLSYDDLVKGLYCSPTVKRSIWQAVLISKELKKINGCAPAKVFIEVTRGKDKKQKGKMKSSRRTRIEELLNAATKQCTDITQLLSELNGKEESELRSDRLYLYFTQLGKCMYTGNQINLAQLNNNDLYDIDHVYPQSKIKDDSLTNRVLVCRGANADKSDKYPINSSIQAKMKTFWSALKEKQLITSEKFDRLTCTKNLTDDQIGGFINRQLVSTNQAVKETANVLKVIFGEDTQIVYSKASHVSDFRHNHGFIKCREVNNLHHAHDAYLNIVVGNVWHCVYGQYWLNGKWGNGFTFNEDKAFDKMFYTDRAGFWKVGYLKKIESYLFDNKKYLGKYPVTIRPFEKKGAFYDQTIHPKGKAQFPLHKGYDTAKYGGYKTGTTAYNCVIEYDKVAGSGKNKTTTRVRGFFPVPVRFVGFYEGDKLLAKLAEINSLTNPQFIVKRILLDSVIEVDSVRYYARTGDLQCPVAMEWYPEKDIIQITHNIYKYMRLVKDKKMEFVTIEKSKGAKESKKVSRADNAKLYDAIMEQLKKPFFAAYPFTKKVKNGTISRDKFCELPTHAQVKQLQGLLNAITLNGKNFDAKQIGGVANEVPVYIVSSITGKNIYLIAQSVTGLFENRVEINSVKG